MVTENGLWMKDQVDNKILIVNAQTLKDKTLKNVSINQFSENFEIEQNIIADEVNIEKNIWIIKKCFSAGNSPLEIQENIAFKTNFNFKQISKLFSDLSSLNFIELRKLDRTLKKVDIL